MGSGRRRSGLATLVAPPLAVLLLAAPLLAALLAVLLLLGPPVGAKSGAGRPVAPADHGDGCDEPAYALHGTRQYDDFTWVVNVSSIPSYLDRAGTVRAIRRATATVAEGRTTCVTGRDLAPALPRAIYTGPTRRQANITTTALCFPPANTDGINVVSFGHLPAQVVAVTCTYVDRTDIWQSDIMLNDEPGLFTLDPGDGRCAGSYDLEAVMTHERGHSFGLAHVEESEGSNDLTMSSIMSTCDASARTLGWGDALGLSLVYH